jgi:PhnB protein
MQVPDQYLPIMPYLLVPGAYRFIEFVQTVFGATVQYTTDRSPGILMHGELRIGPAVLMVADATEAYPPFPASMFLYVEKVDEVFTKATAHADVVLLQELDDRPYGRGGGFRDPFGNAWWVNSPL